jgi:hypothetical protein
MFAKLLKNKFQKFLIGLTLLVMTGFDSVDTWTILNNRTWRSDVFAGSEIIFYETANGLRKAILQIHGSGVPLAGATIFDVETNSEGAVLKDGLDLRQRDNKVFEPIQLTMESDSVLIINNTPYRKIFDGLVAFNWQGKIASPEYLDIGILKSISIGKKSIYDKDCFKK